MAWDRKNLAAYEHLSFIDPINANMMEALEASNAAKEAECLNQKHYYRSLLTCYVAERCLSNLTDEVYIEKWYEVCRGVFTSMSWPHGGQLSSNMDDTILNAWRRAKVHLDEEGWEMATTFTFERLTGKKPNIMTLEGCTAFNNFTNTYNRFCTEQNFNPTEGFDEVHDAFF
jgi:hypothetical protein